MFTSDNGLLLPGVPNAVTALIAADLEFDVIYLTGAGLTNTYFGLPDIGLISLPDDVSTTAAIADADTGFGNAVTATHTVRRWQSPIPVSACC